MSQPSSLSTPDHVVEQVRDRYSRIATGETSGCGCACSGGETTVAESIGYSAADLSSLPDEANLGLGCGAPVGFLHLARGETVVDLGSGAGIDAFLAARAVGPTGRVIGVDMTPEMIDRAARRRFARLRQRRVPRGPPRALPLEDASVDAVTSNCVINLAPTRPSCSADRARAEAWRTGSRLGHRPRATAAGGPGQGCARLGRLRRRRGTHDLLRRLEAAGLTGVEVLRDVDFAASLAKASPAEADALLGRLGLTLADVHGVVHSITYRARKHVESRALSRDSR
jgi:SAM-dependent methyltransferase